MKVYVTRPAPDAETTCKNLIAAGVDAATAPLMDIVLNDTALPVTEGDTVLAFTSANGVRAWAQRTGAAFPVFAVGEATAKAATDAGLTVEAVAGGDVDHLLSILKDRAAGRAVLHVRGRHATGDLVGRLRAADVKADFAALYEARVVDALPENLAHGLAAKNAAIAVFSPRTMRLLIDLAGKAGMTGQLGSATAFCLSQAVADAAGTSHFSHIEVAKAPTLLAFVDMVRSRGT